MADLIKTLGRIRDSEHLLGASEEATRQGAVLPVFADLGWDTYDLSEVVPEFGIAGRRVDYCLKIGRRNSVFVEVKRTTEELIGHQKQLLDYAFADGIPLAVLTNGLQWWLYLVMETGPWEQRKFLSIDLREQGLEKATESFVTFLGKASVASGSAVENARALRETHQRSQKIAEALPEAWERILEEPDEFLVELLIERTESMSSYRPDTEDAVAFLEGAARRNHAAAPGSIRSRRIEPVRATSPTSAETQRPTQERGTSSGVTGKKPKSVTVFGQTHYVDSWKAVLLVVCQTAHERKPAEFNQVLEMSGRKRKYFSLRPADLFYAALIPGSEVYAETNLSANDVVRRCREVLRAIGGGADDLAIQT